MLLLVLCLCSSCGGKKVTDRRYETLETEPIEIEESTDTQEDSREREIAMEGFYIATSALLQVAQEDCIQIGLEYIQANNFKDAATAFEEALVSEQSTKDFLSYYMSEESFMYDLCDKTISEYTDIIYLLKNYESMSSSEIKQTTEAITDIVYLNNYSMLLYNSYLHLYSIRMYSDDVKQNPENRSQLLESHWNKFDFKDIPFSEDLTDYDLYLIWAKQMAGESFTDTSELRTELTELMNSDDIMDKASNFKWADFIKDYLHGAFEDETDSNLVTL